MATINFNILNQLQTPAFYASSLATRPAFGFAGRIFIDTDIPSTGLYRDTGSAWVAIADPGAGTTGTLQQVTTNGNTTTLGINIGGNLGVGTTTPGTNIDVHGTNNVLMQLNNTVGTNDCYLAFLSNGAGMWRVGEIYDAGVKSFSIYDTPNALTRYKISHLGTHTFTGSIADFSGRLNINGAVDSANYAFSMIGSQLIKISGTLPNVHHITFAQDNDITSGWSLKADNSGNFNFTRLNAGVYASIAFSLTSAGTITTNGNSITIGSTIGSGTGTLYSKNNFFTALNYGTTGAPIYEEVLGYSYNAFSKFALETSNSYTNNQGTGLRIKLTTYAGAAIYPLTFAINTGDATFTGNVDINNPVQVSVATPSTHKVSILIGGVQYYLLATNI
jgi:hypothetical protein